MKKRTILTVLLLTLALSLLLFAACKNAEPEKNPDTEKPAEGSDVLKIVKQPETGFEIEIPDGFTLTVEVNDESLVKSYQWQVRNGTQAGGYEYVDLDCSSARTKTLVRPSTEATAGADSGLAYRCNITSTKGETLQSEEAKITTKNPMTYIKSISVCGYAVRAGKVFDLSDTALGSGKISFNEEGNVLTLDNVLLDNTNPVYDYYDSGIGVDVLVYDYPYKTFTVKVKGVNNVVNTYWQPNENSGGIPFCFNFMRNSVCENVVFEGDGSLSVTGGTHLIYANTKVTINCDMTFGKIAHRYATGVNADEIEIGEDVNIDADLNGFLFQTSLGNVTIGKGSIINLLSTPPMVSVGATNFRAVSSAGSFVMKGASFHMILQANADVYEDEYHGSATFTAILTHYGDISLTEGSDLDVIFKASAPNYEDFYVMNGSLLDAEEGNVVVKDSDIRCGAKTEYVFNFCGVFANDVLFQNANADISVTADGSVLGFSMQGKLTVDSSDLKVYAHSLSGLPVQKFGIISTGFEMIGSSFVSVDTNGVAMAVMTGSGDEAKSWTEGYVANVLDGCTIAPADAVVNVWCMEGSISDYVYFETVYAAGERENPIEKLTLTND